MKNVCAAILVGTLLATCLDAIAGDAPSQKKSRLSKADRDIVFQGAEDIAKCAGYFEFLSLWSRAETPQAAENLHELNNGWIMAAAWTLFSMDVIADWKLAVTYSEERAEATIKDYKGLLETKQHKELKKRLQVRAVACADEGLTKFQEEQVVELRRHVYSSGVSKKQSR